MTTIGGFFLKNEKCCQCAAADLASEKRKSDLKKLSKEMSVWLKK